MTHITIPRETVQQAIDALELSRGALIEVSPCSWKECHQHQVDAVEYTPPKIDAAITALRTALEAPNPPHECKTEAEKIAFAFGWWKALEVNRAAPAAREPLTDERYNDLVMEHLGPHALTGGKMSVYDAFLLAIRATEAAHGIGTQRDGV